MHRSVNRDKYKNAADILKSHYPHRKSSLGSQRGQPSAPPEWMLDDPSAPPEWMLDDPATPMYTQDASVPLDYNENAELQKRLAVLNISKGNRYMQFSVLGTGKASVLPRLVALWMIGLPVIITRLLVGFLILAITMSTLQFGCVTIVAGTSIPFQAVYRDITAWAMDNDGLQQAWDVAARVLSLSLSILVFSIRLLVEIWNGLCPFISLFIDVVFEAMKLLVMVWYAAPVLQYFAMWLLRLVILTMEPYFDCLVAIVEVTGYVFIDLVNGIAEIVDQDGGSTSVLVSQLSETGGDVPVVLKRQAIMAESIGYSSIRDYIFYCERNVHDAVCEAYSDAPDALDNFLAGLPPASRRLFQVGSGTQDSDFSVPDNSATNEFVNDFIQPVGDKLLAIVVIILTAHIRIFQALVVAFLPVMASFFLKVLPLAIPLVTFLVQFIAKAFSIMTSDGARRILDFIIQAFPIIWEALGSILCTLVAYLGPVLCYVIYGITIIWGFFMEYLLAPIVCFSSAVVGGCLENFFFRENSGSCTSCGRYNTACGCDINMVPANRDCNSGVCHHINTVPPPPPNCAIGTCTDAELAAGGFTPMPPLKNKAQGGGTRGASYTNMSTLSQTSDNIGSYVSGGSSASEFETIRTSVYTPEDLTLGKMRVDISATGASGKEYKMSDDPQYGSGPSYTASNSSWIPPQNMDWVQNLHHQVVSMATATGEYQITDQERGSIHITGSPSVYAGVTLETLFTGESVLMWGAMMFNHSSGELGCEYGIDPETSCKAFLVHSTLEDYISVSPRDVIEPNNKGWEPVFWGQGSKEASPIPYWDLNCDLPTQTLFSQLANPCPWLRLQLPWNHEITSYSALWEGGMGNGLQAPQKYTVAFHTGIREDYTTSTAYTHTSTQCSTVPRLDYVSFGRDEPSGYGSSSPILLNNVQTIVLFVQTSCSVTTNNYMSTVRLIQFNLYGKNSTTESTTQSASLVDHLGYPLAVSVLSPSSELQLWDPCGTATPQAIRDGQNRYASLFHYPADGIDLASFGLHFKYIETVKSHASVNPTVVTLHLSPTARVDNSKVWLCYNDQEGQSGSLSMVQPNETTPEQFASHMSTVALPGGEVVSFLYTKTNQVLTGELCVNADNILSGRSVCERKPCDFRSDEIDASFEEQLGEIAESSPIKNMFFTESYQEEVGGEFTRGSSISFVLLPKQSFSMKEFVVWFGRGSLSHSRVTTWETAAIETGMDTTITAENYWMHDVANQVLSSSPHSGGQGKSTPAMLYNSDLVVCGWNSDSDTEWVNAATSTPIDYSHVSLYATPWGDTGNKHRAWIGVTEIEVLGTHTPHQEPSGGGSRRTLSVEVEEFGDNEGRYHTNQTRLNMQQDLERALYMHNRTTQPRATDVNTHVPVEHILHNHGRHIHNGMTDDISYRSTLSSPESAQHQPFYEDLHMMPDHTSEAMFACTSALNTDTMTCHTVAPFRLDHDATEQAPEKKDEESSKVTTRHSAQQSGVQSMPPATQEIYDAIHEQLSQLNSDLALRDLLDARLHDGRTTRLIETMLEKQVALVSAQNGTIDKTAPHSALMQSSRRLMFWNAVGDGVKDLVMGLLREFERLIASAIQCDKVCNKDWNSCSGSELGPCLQNFPEFILRGILDCQSADNSLTDCIEMRILEPLLKALMMLLRYILRLFDMWAGMVRGWFMMGDIVELLACMACRITTIAAGVLADFMQSFEMSLCTNIVDKGTAQCERWGLDAETSGFAVFETFFPVLKVTFGVIQIIPAIWEITIEVVMLLSSELIEMVPELLSVAFDVLLWIITLDEILPAFLTVIEAFGPAIQGGFMQSEMVDATSKSSSPNPDTSIHESSHAFDSQCFSGSSGDGVHTDGQCVPSYAHKTSTTLNSDAIRGQQAPSVGAGDDLAFDLGGCGCTVKQRSCEDGPGVGNCGFSQGSHAARLAKSRQKAAVYQNDSTISPSDTSTWPICPTSNHRLLPGKGSDYTRSGETKRIPVESKMCVIEGIAPTADDTPVAKTWPFTGFSRRDGVPNTNDPLRRRTVKGGVYGEDYTSQFAPSRPHLSEIHRRRATPPPASSSRRLTGIEAKVVMGVSDMFSDIPGHKIEAARKTISMLLQSENKTLAHLQIQGLREDIGKLSDLKNDLIYNFTQSTEPMLQKTMERIGSIRKLMGLTGVDVNDIGCGWSDIEGFAPNTYPCCQGLW